MLDSKRNAGTGGDAKTRDDARADPPPPRAVQRRGPPERRWVPPADRAPRVLSEPAVATGTQPKKSLLVVAFEIAAAERAKRGG